MGILCLKAKKQHRVRKGVLKAAERNIKIWCFLLLLFCRPIILYKLPAILWAKKSSAGEWKERGSNWMIVDMSLKCFSFHLFFMFLFAERLSAFSHNISIIFSHLGTNDHFALRFVVRQNRLNAFYSVLWNSQYVLAKIKKGRTKLYAAHCLQHQSQCSNVNYRIISWYSS